MNRKQLRQIITLIGALSALTATYLGAAIAQPEAKDLNTPVTVEEIETSNQKLPSSQEYFKVVRVIDGDTIDVFIEEKKERVRLIGLNTPEVVDPNRPAQCFGKEASDYAHKLLDNQQVHLVADPVAGDRDKFGRLLRYVYRTDGLFIQEDIILRGFGFEYTYRNQKYAKRSVLQSAQNIAKQSAEGLWSPNTCAGELKKAN